MKTEMPQADMTGVFRHPDGNLISIAAYWMPSGMVLEVRSVKGEPGQGYIQLLETGPKTVILKLDRMVRRKRKDLK